jgi:peptidoglycan/LPS O-acetylase OafA/YrhL
MFTEADGGKQMGLVRLLLAISVVVWHTGTLFGHPVLHGYLAVQIFFIISGFYMSLILTTKYKDARTFWFNRALRLYPTYLVIVASIWTWYFLQWSWIHHPPMADDRLVEVFANLPIWQRWAIHLSNWTMIGQDIIALFYYEPGVGFVSPGNPLKQTEIWASSWTLIMAAWSLGIELWFYVLAPWLVKQSSRLLAVIMGASFATHMIVTALCGSDFSNNFFPSCLWLFLLGLLLQRLGVNKVPLRLIAISPVIAAAIVLMWPFPGKVRDPSSLWQSLLAIAIFAPLVPLIFEATRKSRWDNKAGELSYSIYVSHIFVAGVLSIFRIHSAPIIVTAVIAFLIVLHRLIESPIDRWRQAIARKSIGSIGRRR